MNEIMFYILGTISVLAIYQVCVPWSIFHAGVEAVVNKKEEARKEMERDKFEAYLCSSKNFSSRFDWFKKDVIHDLDTYKISVSRMIDKLEQRADVSHEDLKVLFNKVNALTALMDEVKKGGKK